MILFFALIWLFVSDSASIVAQKVRDSNTVHLLNNVNIIEEINTGEITVRVIELKNESGSAGQPNGEVTSNVYFAVSEHAEYPVQNMFLIQSLYGPKVERIQKKKDSVEIQMSFVVNSTRQNILVSVSLTNCVVRKK